MRAHRLIHHEVSVEKTQRTFIRLLLGGLLVGVLLVAMVWGGHDIYLRWQERRLVRRGVAALEQYDLRNASLAARTVLQMKPDSAGADRIMAEVMERAGDRSAIDWRRKVVKLEPNSVEDILALARCALQFNDLETAKGALAQASEQGKGMAGYHAVAALIAEGEKQSEKEVREWAEAVRLAPNDKTYQLKFGIARLRSSDPERHRAGEAALRELRSDPEQQAAATRALITEGVARRERARTLVELARDLQSYPDATLTDRILYVDFLHQTQDPEFSTYLDTLEKNSAGRPIDLAALISWMSRNNLNLLAIDFLKRLPAEAYDKWPASASVADVYVRLGEWLKLENFLKSANWRELDFLRHAYLARALRGQDKPAAAEHEWSAALKGASTNAEASAAFLRILTEWKWEAEALDLLWTMSKDPERQGDAMAALYQHYASKGDTTNLYRLLARRCESRPDDEKAQNNFAQLALLLNLDTARARETAERLYKKEPDNAVYVSTYAFSLYRLEKFQKAVEVMSNLKPEDLNQPEIAAYYGIFLAAAGDAPKAAQYLERAKNAVLLPEEKALVKSASDKVGAR